jgi:hypothetical protein
MITAEDIVTNTRIIASDRVVGCEIDGEIVLLHLDTGIYFGLNPVGAEIWNYIREEKSLEQIRDHLLSRYDVPRSRCETEVRALLGNLVAQGLAGIRNDEDNS